MGLFQIGQCSTLGDRFDDFGRERGQRNQAGDVAISNALATGNRGQRSRPAGEEFLEPPVRPVRSLLAERHQACVHGVAKKTVAPRETEAFRFYYV